MLCLLLDLPPQLFASKFVLSGETQIKNNSIIITLDHMNKEDRVAAEVNLLHLTFTLPDVL